MGVVLMEIIKKPYMRLVMGKSSDYYIDIIETIYILYGNNPFIWGDIISKTNSKVNKSILTRLKYSDWIIMVQRGRTNHIPTTWSLHLEAINIVRDISDRRPK